MSELNLNAPIVAGQSAAGFVLGQHISELTSVVNQAIIVNRGSGIPLAERLKNSHGWLVIDHANFDGIHKKTFFYQNDCVRLQFDADEYLRQIYVFNGYAGLYAGNIGIGSKLVEVETKYKTYFDEGEEMHYFDCGDEKIGISFYANDEPLDTDPDQLIQGFCIYNT